MWPPSIESMHPAAGSNGQHNCFIRSEGRQLSTVTVWPIQQPIRAICDASDDTRTLVVNVHVARGGVTPVHSDRRPPPVQRRVWKRAMSEFSDARRKPHIETPGHIRKQARDSRFDPTANSIVHETECFAPHVTGTSWCNVLTRCVLSEAPSQQYACNLIITNRTARRCKLKRNRIRSSPSFDHWQTSEARLCDKHGTSSGRRICEGKLC